MLEIPINQDTLKVGAIFQFKIHGLLFFFEIVKFKNRYSIRYIYYISIYYKIQLYMYSIYFLINLLFHSVESIFDILFSCFFFFYWIHAKNY